MVEYGKGREEGTVAIVTGGASGIGAAIARRSAREVLTGAPYLLDGGYTAR